MKRCIVIAGIVFNYFIQQEDIKNDSGRSNLSPLRR